MSILGNLGNVGGVLGQVASNIFIAMDLDEHIS
jgi:hypothetical protein